MMDGGLNPEPPSLPLATREQPTRPWHIPTPFPPRILPPDLDFVPWRWWGRPDLPVYASPVYTTNPYLRPMGRTWVQLIYYPDLAGIIQAEREL